MIPYQECVPIRQRPCSAWLLETPSKKAVVLCDPHFTAEEVVQMCAVHHPVFTVQQLWVGEFAIKEHEDNFYYSADSRRVDQDMMVCSLPYTEPDPYEL